MPHLIVSEFEPPRAKTSRDGVTFAFASSGEEGVAGVETASKRFLLRWFSHPQGTILKVDKSTRPPLLGTIKRALCALAKIGGGSVVSDSFANFTETASDRLYEARDFIEGLGEKRLWIEIGFGSGRHILHNAALAPDRLHLGIELHRPSAEQLLRRAKHEQISNVAVIVSDARAVISALPTACADRLFVHFPIPWNDSPKRRIFNDEFIGEALRVLTKGGTIELRTDSPSYYEEALNLAQKTGRVGIETHKNSGAAIVSKYEDRWRRFGRDFYDLIITNQQNSPARNTKFNFSFDRTISPRKALEKLGGLLLKTDEFLLRTADSWLLNGGGAFLQLIFGAVNMPCTTYILIENDRPNYYPFDPLETRQNYAAHLALLKALYE